MSDVSMVITEFSAIIIDASRESLLSTLKNGDRYKFINFKDESQTLEQDRVFCIGFSHYLIRKAILSAILPKKMEQLHCLFFNLYEEKLNQLNISENVWRSPFVQLILTHVLDLPGHDAEKIKYLQIALEGSAKLCLFNDGIHYGNLLSKLIDDGKCSFADKTMFHRYMSLLYAQNV